MVHNVRVELVVYARSGRIDGRIEIGNRVRVRVRVRALSCLSACVREKYAAEVHARLVCICAHSRGPKRDMIDCFFCLECVTVHLTESVSLQPTAKGSQPLRVRDKNQSNAPNDRKNTFGDFVVFFSCRVPFVDLAISARISRIHHICVICFGLFYVCRLSLVCLHLSGFSDKNWNWYKHSL